MLVYKIIRDQKSESDKIENDFKSNLFASNPQLFQELYNTQPDHEQFEIEEFVPQSEADVERMLAQLKREGIIH